MSRPAVQSLLVIVTMLSTCIAIAEETPPASLDENAVTFLDSDDCITEPEDGNSDNSIPSFLRPDLLPFVSAEEGQTVPLNSIIVMPMLMDDDEALLIIEFARRDLNEAFVQAVFLDRQLLVPVDHPYTHIGVEYLLTEERLILKIYPHVILHLRDDFRPLRFGLPDETEFQRLMFTSRDSRDIFKNDDAVGQVVLVSGNVHVSTDPEYARSNLHNVHTQLRGSSADDIIRRICSRMQPNASNAQSRWFPDSFAPRVLRGR